MIERSGPRTARDGEPVCFDAYGNWLVFEVATMVDGVAEGFFQRRVGVVPDAERLGLSGHFEYPFLAHAIT